MIDVEKVKRNVDIVDFISRYTDEIKRTHGDKYITKCPLHDDNSPSMSIDREKGLWNCFAGCGGGDIIEFVELMENIDFKQALNKLCDSKEVKKCDINYNNNREFIKLIQEIKENKSNNDFGENLVAKYKENQHKMFGDKFKDTTLDYFDIGYCFDPIDELDDRIVIPWRDENGELVALVGRETWDSKAKYKAASGSSKKNHLFNLNNAKKYDEIIIVESEKCAMRLHEWGYPNVVALGGSQLNGRKFKLRKYVDEISSCLDNDEAGRKATNKIYEQTKFMFKVNSILLPDNVKDVAECSKEQWEDSYDNKVEVVK